MSRSERVTLAALALASLAAIAFAVFYIVEPDTQLLGLALGLAFAFLGVAAIVAGKRVVSQEKVAEEYPKFGDPLSQEKVAEELTEGISRRRLLTGATATAGLTLGAALVLPITSLGPKVGNEIDSTPWRRGRRLVTEDGEPLRADDVVEHALFTAFPEGDDRRDLGSPLIVVRIPLERLQLAPDRRDSAPDGVIAFSKICPHAGCAVSIYRDPDALICPCHYSTFDPARGGARVFGPAGRALPQLPLAVDAEGVLVAAGGFYDPVGPSA